MVIYSIENFEAIIVSICVCTCISWSQLKANALHDIYIYIYKQKKWASCKETWEGNLCCYFPSWNNFLFCHKFIFCTVE